VDMRYGEETKSNRVTEEEIVKDKEKRSNKK
jgi:hypothetical protein